MTILAAVPRFRRTVDNRDAHLLGRVPDGARHRLVSFAAPAVVGLKSIACVTRPGGASAVSQMLSDVVSRAAVLPRSTRCRSAVGSNSKAGTTLHRGSGSIEARRQNSSLLTRPWREMDSKLRFLVVRPSNRHGSWDCCLENGSGSVGEPKVRIHLPPLGSRSQLCLPYKHLAGRSAPATPTARTAWRAPGPRERR
jgi:hypothetical protein